ncbi:MAG: carboxypeptidase M32 [Lentisphaeria bacterium]|nr:carboxypeptidase M32 [Lentisphaeria bacterium]NQZ70287.1 carboxypeptidase M32 [Lentisphaeria bacterium]
MSYEKLKETFSTLYNLNHLGSIAYVDQAVMMPVGANDARSKAMGTLSKITHEMITDSTVGEQLKAAEDDDLSGWDAANLSCMKRRYEAATLLPSDFVAKQTEITMNCEHLWRQLRHENDWKQFQPALESVLELAIEEADIKAQHYGLSPYNALLDGYEEGLSTERVDTIFGTVKPFLIDLIPTVLEKQEKEFKSFDFDEVFSIEDQKSLGLEIMGHIGFDFDHGRLDVSHHPFCGGVPEDVRITTRYNTDEFGSSIMGVIHETGHAMYEQNLPKDYLDQPVGHPRGMLIHESQSLIMEMQACRSREFTSFLLPKLKERWTLKGLDTDEDLEMLYLKVKPSYIRVDADELTYPLHIMMRYEIEKKLISREMTVADIPEAWESYMQEFFGLSTKKNGDYDYADGCMQDPHWAFGGFGYFPTYSLGAMAAAQLFAKAKEENSDCLSTIANGDFIALNSWLNKNLRNLGSSKTYDEILTDATGSDLDPQYFMTHITKRYLG